MLQGRVYYQAFVNAVMNLVVSQRQNFLTSSEIVWYRF
jgi:hypothetical protein